MFERLMHHQLTIRVFQITLFPWLIFEVKILKEGPSERSVGVLFGSSPGRVMLNKLIHLVLKKYLGLFLAYLNFMQLTNE